MRKAILDLASTVLAVLIASTVALVAVEETAQAAFPGENGSIAYSSYAYGGYDIYSIRPGEGYSPTQLTFSVMAGYSDIYPAYSPDGTSIAYARWDGQNSKGPNYDIWVLSQDGTSERQVTDTATDEMYPSYSPDGTTIVYSSNDGQDEEIYAVPVSGGAPSQLTDNSKDDVSPVYSPDGTTIAYQSHDGQDYEITTMPANGGTPVQLTDNATGDSYPDYSPDGARLVYGHYDGQDVEIYSMPASGGMPTRLTDNTLPDTGAVYSPDGTTIAYQSHDGQDYEITTMPANGGTPAQLTDNATADVFPNWGVAVAAPPDITEPETIIDSGPEGLTNDPTPSFTFIGSDDTTARANLLYSYKIDGEEWSTYSTDTIATRSDQLVLSEGVHTFYVKAKDEEGNEDVSPAERSFTVDTAAPTTRPPARGFVAGSTLGTTAVPILLSWSATDVGSGLAAYQLQQSVNGGAYADVSLPSGTTTVLTVTLDPNKTYQYRARAQDKVGNWSEWVPGPSFTLATVQENGSGVAYPAGKWTRATLSGAYGGYVKYASASGARAQFAFTGDEVAWVSTKSANRGKAEVWLDGVKVATVDLYSATSQARRVVFSKGGLDPTKSHTLEVRVLGTKNAASSGKRVDVDAFVALR